MIKLTLQTDNDVMGTRLESYRTPKGSARKIKAGTRSLNLEYGIRLDGCGTVRCAAKGGRLIAEIWNEGESLNHFEILDGNQPTRIIVGEGEKLSIRCA